MTRQPVIKMCCPSVGGIPRDDVLEFLGARVVRHRQQCDLIFLLSLLLLGCSLGSKINRLTFGALAMFALDTSVRTRWSLQGVTHTALSRRWGRTWKVRVSSLLNAAARVIAFSRRSSSRAQYRVGLRRRGCVHANNASHQNSPNI